MSLGMLEEINIFFNDALMIESLDLTCGKGSIWNQQPLQRGSNIGWGLEKEFGFLWSKASATSEEENKNKPFAVCMTFPAKLRRPVPRLWGPQQNSACVICDKCPLLKRILLQNLGKNKTSQLRLDIFTKLMPRSKHKIWDLRVWCEEFSARKILL